MIAVLVQGEDKKYMNSYINRKILILKLQSPPANNTTTMHAKVPAIDMANS